MLIWRNISSTPIATTFKDNKISQEFTVLGKFLPGQFPLSEFPTIKFPRVNYHLAKFPPGEFPSIKFPNPNPNPDPGGNSLGAICWVEFGQVVIHWGNLLGGGIWLGRIERGGFSGHQSFHMVIQNMDM